MLTRLLFVVEFLFLVTFWWQTRIDLSRWWPDIFYLPLNSDYIIPFIYLSDILLSLLLLTWFIQLFSGSRLGFLQLIHAYLAEFNLRNWILSPKAWLGLLVGTALFSLIINQVGWWGWYGWLRLVEGVLFAVYMNFRLKEYGILAYYLLLLMIGLAGESILLIVEWFAQRSLGLQWIGEWRFDVYTPGIAKITYQGGELLRSHGTFAHPNVAGGVLSLALIILVWIIGKSKKPNFNILKPVLLYTYDSKNKLIESIAGLIQSSFQKFSEQWRISIILFFILFGFGLFVTFSRSAWLIALMGVMLVGILSDRISFPKLSHGRWLTIATALLMVMVIVGPLVISRFLALETTDVLSIDRRVQLMNVAWELWKTSPWVGVGIQDFVPQLMGYGPLYGIGIWREPVHNLFMLIAVEIGVIGLLSWVIALALIIYQFTKILLKRRDDEVGLLLILWIGFLLLALVDHYWWTSQQSRLVMWMLVGGSLSRLSGKFSEN